MRRIAYLAMKLLGKIYVLEGTYLQKNPGQYYIRLW